jgi:hypothetical protein
MYYFTNFINLRNNRILTTFLLFPILFLFCFSFNDTQAQNFAPLSLGMNNTVQAVTVWNGYLIAGGEFTTAGGSPVNRIAKWNGNSWTPLGSGMNNTVRALVVYNNNLYAGGDFTTAGGSNTYRVAKWNGTSWSGLGVGLNGNVYALEVYSGSLIAAGGFTTAGGVGANHIARWNGSNWYSLGSGTNSDIFTLTVFNNLLIVGGEFTAIASIPVLRIASWNGGSWSTLANGIDNGTVNALTVYNNNLIVGGSFTTIGSVTMLRVAAWNGTSWSQMGAGVNDPVFAFTHFLGDMYMGGIFTNSGSNPAYKIAKWAGTNWTGLGVVNGSVYTLGTYNSALILGGSFTNAGGNNMNKIAQWGSLPAAPSLLFPANGSQGISLTTTLDWTDVYNASSYGVQVSMNPQFTNNVVNQTNLAASEYTIPVNTLNPNTVYFWRANAENGMGSGPFSPFWFFTTMVTNIQQTSSETPEEFKLYNNYPNPFNPATKIKFDLPEKSFVKLVVYDALGREIKVLVNDYLSPGKYISEWSGFNHTSGTYFYRFEAGKNIETKKMLLIK